MNYKILFTFFCSSNAYFCVNNTKYVKKRKNKNNSSIDTYCNDGVNLFFLWKRVCSNEVGCRF